MFHVKHSIGICTCLPLWFAKGFTVEKYRLSDFGKEHRLELASVKDILNPVRFIPTGF